MIRILKMKYFISIVLVLSIRITALPQAFSRATQVDDLRLQLSQAKQDTSRVLILLSLAEAHRTEHPDSTMYYGQQGLDFSRQLNYPTGELRALLAISGYYRSYGNFPRALEVGLKGLEIARRENFITDQAFAYIRIGNIYMNLNDFREGLNNFLKANKLVNEKTHPFFYAASFWRACDAYESLNILDSALYMGNRAFEQAEKMNNRSVKAGVSRAFGKVYARKGDHENALQYYRRAIALFTAVKTFALAADVYVDLATLYQSTHQIDSAIYYATKAEEIGRQARQTDLQLKAATLLSKLYEESDPVKALKYLQQANAVKDSVFSTEKVLALHTVSFEEKERKIELELATINYRNQIRQYGLMGGMGLLFVVAAGLYRNNRTKQKANKLLESQKAKIESTLTELKSTQAQLIQSEKMASLGELTAGIAHEIQNPLNFVNNFSDVNAELIDDLKKELASGHRESAEEIADTIKENEVKINHHGKRADGIVKNMLQHSRSSTGQKELTDINVLCDEYLRLAYHGFRAKDKSFIARLESDLDPTSPKVIVIAQEIGRVILNLVNNAFYAVNEKSRRASGGYEPCVKVVTRIHNEMLEIRISDNGRGISSAIRDKIFQPFFTTKPPGQGTGLGLSLAYDIITKAHGGELKVESEEGKGSEFIILLPLSKNP